MPRPRSPKRPSAGLGDLAELWAEPAPKRPVVTREHLVREALALLDEVGFDGLTMRRLAERLGVQAASLYNHVRDKDELLTLLADAICGEIRDSSSASGQPWRKQLEALGWDYRRVLLAHRDAARVLVATPPMGPRRMRLIEQVLAVLRRAGFSDEDVADAASVFNTLITGFVLDETRAFISADLPEVPADEMRGQVERWFKSLPPERFPTVVALADQLLENNMDRPFELGLGLLLDGLELRLARSVKPKGLPRDAR